MTDMLTKIAAKMVSLMPSSVKLRLVRLQPLMQFLYRPGRIIAIQTKVGVIHWKVDHLTSQRHILATYEPYMQDALSEYVRSSDVVYDVGAHAGFHSLILGHLVGPGGHVVAFEPYAPNRASLEEQVRLNPELPITVLSHGLSSSEGQVGFNTSAGNSQGRISEQGTGLIEVRTIDSLVRSASIPPPRLLKIDVEGHEADVVRGAREAIERYRPIFVIDYNDDTTLAQVAAVLEPFHYTIRLGPPIVAMPA